MAKTSVKEKARAMRGSGEPQINMLTYNEDILKYMNYHSVSSTDDQRRLWVAKGMVAMERTEDIQWLEDTSDFELSQLGPLMWARDRDMYLSNKHLTFIDNEVNRLVAKYKAKAGVVVVDDKPKGPSQQEKHEALARHFYGEEVQCWVDYVYLHRDFTFAGLDPKAWLISNNIPAAVATMMAEKLVPTVLEVKEAVEGTDEQVNESYAHWKKADLRKLLEALQGILQAFVTHGQVVKAMRKPRVPKKPKTSPVAKLKYLESFMELNLRSINPEVILGADEFYAYRTNRRLIYYKAKAGETLQIKGQTIMGYDEELSGAKTIRKPEKFFPGLNMARKALKTAFDNIQSSKGDAPPRISDDVILLKAFT